ncbi:MAG: hypothetical protein ACR2P0_00620, partial [Acidimicrobiales bacterium]
RADSEVALAYIADYRAAYDEVLDAVAAIDGGPRVLRFDTSSTHVDAMLHDVQSIRTDVVR